MRKQDISGFSLLEVIIASAIIAMICGISLSLTVNGLNTSNNIIYRSDVQQQAMLAVNMIAKELMLSSWKTISPTFTAPNSSNYITYQKIISYNYDTDQFTLGTVNKFEFKKDTETNSLCVFWNNKIISSGVSEFAKGETSTSGDENGNGLNNESGLSFEKIGNQSIIVRLTLQKIARDKLIQEYAETLVHVRQP